MPEAVYRMLVLLTTLVEPLPVGTNLGLLQLLWMLASGRLLGSRGAVIPGLSACGLPARAVRRAWAALGPGGWTSAGLLQEEGVPVRAASCEELVLSDAPPGAPSFAVVAVYDPRFREPLLLASPLPLEARVLRDMYRGRRPAPLRTPRGHLTQRKLESKEAQVAQARWQWSIHPRHSPRDGRYVAHAHGILPERKPVYVLVARHLAGRTLQSSYSRWQRPHPQLVPEAL